MEEANRNELNCLDRRTLRDVSDEVPAQTIINFESGRKALEKAWLEEELWRLTVSLNYCTSRPKRMGGGDSGRLNQG
jgi:hypothetical protein